MPGVILFMSLRAGHMREVSENESVVCYLLVMEMKGFGCPARSEYMFPGSHRMQQAWGHISKLFGFFP